MATNKIISVIHRMHSYPSTVAASYSVTHLKPQKIINKDVDPTFESSGKYPPKKIILSM
jgi:hypothetical protein